MARPLTVLAWPAGIRDGGNPYHGLLYKSLRPLAVEADDFTLRKLLTGTYDIVHLHWPNHLLLRTPRTVGYLKAAVFLAGVRLARRRGAKVVWTVHNVAPHEHVWPNRAESLFWRSFVKQVAAIIVLSQAGVDEVVATHPKLRDVPAFPVPHGHYRSYYDAANEDPDDTASVRRGTRYLFFGQLRAYKNVPELIRAFIDSQVAGARLSVVGRAVPPLREEITELANSSDAVDVVLDGVPDREVATLVRGADVLVLPYARVLNSGAAFLALSFDRPVVLPHAPTFVELQELVGSDWVFLFEPPLSAQTFAEVERWLNGRDGAGGVDLEPFSWDRIAKQTLAVYESVLATPGS